MLGGRLRSKQHSVAPGPARGGPAFIVGLPSVIGFIRYAATVSVTVAPLPLLFVRGQFDAQITDPRRDGGGGRICSGAGQCRDAVRRSAFSLRV